MMLAYNLYFNQLRSLLLIGTIENMFFFSENAFLSLDKTFLLNAFERAPEEQIPLNQERVLAKRHERVLRLEGRILFEPFRCDL